MGGGSASRFEDSDGDENNVIDFFDNLRKSRGKIESDSESDSSYDSDCFVVGAPDGGLLNSSYNSTQSAITTQESAKSSSKKRRRVLEETEEEEEGEGGRGPKPTLSICLTRMTMTSGTRRRKNICSGVCERSGCVGRSN